MASLRRRRHDSALTPTDHRQTELTNPRTDGLGGVELGGAGVARPDEADGKMPCAANGTDLHEGLNRANGLCFGRNRGLYPAPIPRIKPP